MNDPRILLLFTLVFVLLGLYNVNVGFRRRREARARGQVFVWYKQINMLVGIEYVLLALVFLLTVGVRTRVIPSSLTSLITPVYLVVFLGSAVMAGFVIRQGLINVRKSRGQAPAQKAGSNGNVHEADDAALTSEQRQATIERRRERRRNAAAARRRRAGKA